MSSDFGSRFVAWLMEMNSYGMKHDAAILPSANVKEIYPAGVSNLPIVRKDRKTWKQAPHKLFPRL